MEQYVLRQISDFYFHGSPEKTIQSLIALFQAKDKESSSNISLDRFILLLESDPVSKKSVQALLKNCLSKYDSTSLFTYSGILSSHGFMKELWRRTKHNILPELYPTNDARSLIQILFPDSSGVSWLLSQPSETIVRLFQVLEIRKLLSNSNTSEKAMLESIEILSHQLVSLGLDQDIRDRLLITDIDESPFIIQNRLILENTSCSKNLDILSREEIHSALQECEGQIQQIRAKKNEYGTSLHLAFITRRILQIIRRVQLLLEMHANEESIRFDEKLFSFMLELMHAERSKNSIRYLLKENIDLLAFEVVDHTAKKGEKYIAKNSSEYWSYLSASIKGGLIIAMFAFLKIFIEKMSLSPLGEGILFSINYAVCFILVYSIGGIIATKQPAMTASAVAQSMDTNDDGHIDNLPGLKNLIIRVSRSQFISLAGNLLSALPISYLILSMANYLTGGNILSGDKASLLTAEVHPYLSGSLFFACIAGLFLSFSGLFSGYISNKIIFSRIPSRIEAHRQLKKIFSHKSLQKISNYTRHNLPMLTGNITLGFLLGMAGTFGWLSGLAFDIRHVAFSTANIGMAFASGGSFFTPEVIWMSIMGLAGIGLLNFVVSFGFTLTLALKSRQVSFRETRNLFSLLFQHFLKAPQDFFLPPKLFSGWKKYKWSTK